MILFQLFTIFKSIMNSFFWSHRADSSPLPVDTIKYGYLYNWYVVDDVRNISNTGWHVPSGSDFGTLITFLGGSSVAGGKLKETGMVYWNSPNTGATNETSFNGRGSGIRNINGTFSFLLDASQLTTSDTITATKNRAYGLAYDNSALQLQSPDFEQGQSVRLIKDSTTLTNGQAGTYIGNDGKVYRTICIGTQEWLADDLAETKYKNGDIVPTVTDNTTWENLTTGARCAYDNDENNV